MSDTTTANKPAPGFFWFLAAFLGFAVLAALFTSGAGSRPNPRDDERKSLADAIKAEQAANLAKMGLEKGKSAERLNKAAEALKGLPAPAPSQALVPGSPTQLKQAATAPAATPAAPAAPSTPAAPK